MTGKFRMYENLVSKRKECRECAGLLNPSEIEGGIYDCDQIGAWTLWEGNLDAEVMIVGQDFSELSFFVENKGRPSTGARISATNKTLMRLIQEGLGIDIEPFQEGAGNDAPLFFTNAILCIKPGTASSAVKQSWVNRCVRLFLKPLIEDIVRPKVVITLSTPAYLAVRKVFGLNTPSRLLDVLDDPNGIPLSPQTVLFPRAHCSRQVLNIYRDFSQQLEDWKVVHAYLDNKS